MSDSAPPALLSVRELKSPDLAPSSPFCCHALLRRVTAKTARNDNPFLSVEVGDRSGSFQFNVFSDGPLYELLRAAPEGSALLLEGRTEHYQGRFSPRIASARLLSEAEAAQAAETLVEVSPEPVAALEAELRAQVAAVEPAALRATVEGVLAELGAAFLEVPAASAMHHAYRHGLLEHTVHVARVARALLPLYPEVHAGLALAGALLHDTGKALEFEGALAPRRGRTGLLNGHVVLGYRLVRKHGLKVRLEEDLLERLEHIILSHQGELEWGAAVMAATPEAVFVSMVDNLDAKMGMVQRALRTTPETAAFSEHHPGLSSAVLVSPILPPADPPPAS